MVVDLPSRKVNPAMYRRTFSAFIVAVCATAGGCGGAPSAIRPPNVEPGALGVAAVAQYDKDGDGAIGGEELADAPSLRRTRDRMDVDGDGELTPEEIAGFVQKQWIDMAGGIIRVRCIVNLRGRPLDGATIVLEPESFMGGEVKPASGVTRGGMAVLDVSDEDRPHPNAHGVQPGLYLVRISKIVDGQETIPAKYNEETILGCEVADRASYMPGPVVFNLRGQ